MNDTQQARPDDLPRATSSTESLESFVDVLDFGLSGATDDEGTGAQEEDDSFTSACPYDQLDIGKVDLLPRERAKELYQLKRDQVAKAILRRMGPKQLLLKDKITFVLGSTCLWVCAFWLGSSPQSFYKLYTGLGVVLFTFRYLVYRARKWHYYLLDLCYYGNTLLLLHLWVYPRSYLLARTTFALNSGPLAFTILAFRNSLVYHDMDKVTSLYMHLVPVCVSWANRWFPEESRFGPRQDSDSGGLVQLVLWPMAFYMVWSVFYFGTIFVFAAERIKRRGYTTLFSYVTTQKRGPFNSISRRIPPKLHALAYLILHCLFCATTMLLSTLTWRSYLAHTTLLVSMASASIYHGGSFYFEVFARRYYSKPEDHGAQHPHLTYSRKPSESGLKPEGGTKAEAKTE
uniref:Glycerophosphocholine acyltransferase 1 n=1 Tax=Dunaliella tertiolecta TaxID=3047 RepID=A0A7S3QMQ2_DUNTE|mmetsp:Transcript_1710/g.4300  ORF Transcript_1710/g.4300 Transcript_1710/m.4300 type:complete len:402 (+) Transcript_1710:1461-2666(+)|eukprot:CAMPEP_0202358074 /NCGR_PEP_ID=MMETSP1126-20121109/11855_1 /ASSEMBLY_ACC=CAM_ASM_000457 /TAXON_ID=3047 /ORGANISM="Dunaliella tertiolecta, Strain CCMP1320" /LENGTH=401 /DNA_ID=CAMNT_0048951099 /DNA_START=49 /DNA_END=1254 /DNA_ORIENTATION=-